MIAAAFALTLFVSAFLLFLIQPMFTKMVLPLMGGGAFVWNTCIVFFQITLLGGYLYSHLASTRLGVRRHAWTHVGLLALTALALPIRLRAGSLPPGAEPVGWLLLLLTVSIALPFFFLSTTGPLLQRWFAETGRPGSADPYFLYSASNAGSLLALLSYPFVFEPWLRLVDQRALWSVGYGVLIVLIAGCAWLMTRSAPVALQPTARAADRPARRTVLRWIALAAVPSGMMLALTTYLTTDIAPVPLLWIIPLALYLLSFVLVFSRRRWPSHTFWLRIQVPMLILAAALVFWGKTSATPQFMAIHLLGLLVTAMVCHGELARLRPAASNLTAFYLWMSVGGVVGGVFSAIVAPLVFRSIAEYGWLLVAACMLRPPAPATSERRVTVVDMLLLASLVILLLTATLRAASTGSFRQTELSAALPSLIATALVAIMLFASRRRPRHLAVGVALLLIAGPLVSSWFGNTVYAVRNFYGARRVRDDGVTLTLMHGGTTHGSQFKDPARRAEPLTYYHWLGPVADIFRALPPPPVPVRVAVVGLGTGALSAYGRPGDQFDFYEIDPEMVRLARDGRWFTYLAISPARVSVILGDGRIRLAEAADGTYDLIVLDAFNSDAVPVHLMTREAVQLYLRKLRPGGILALHISNRYLDLRPVVAAVAADLGVAARIRIRAPRRTDEASAEGLTGSIWAVLAPDSTGLGPLRGWSRPAVNPRVRAWTDDYSNLFAVFKR